MKTYSLMRISITILLLFILSQVSYSQNNIQVQGKVIETNTNKPLVGASVQVSGTNTGTTTDLDGVFNIHAPSDGILVITSVGFARKEIPIDNQTFITIEMGGGATSLDEVVVTALGIQAEKRSLSYATQSVDAKPLAEIQDPNNFLNSFQGKISNALITQSSGGVGSSANIVLRGNRSISGNSNALVVIDGIPGSVDDVNPDDIESVNVLRGAAGAALYGSAAGNGVIVITTKKGEQGKLRVNFNTSDVFESVIGLPDFQNKYGQGTNGEFNPNSDQSWGDEMKGQSITNYKGEQTTYSPHPNNVRDFFDNKISSKNSISLSGGTEKMSGYFSYTNNNVKGVIPGNRMMDNTIDLRLTSRLSKRITVDGKVTYAHRNQWHIPRGSEGNRPIMDIFNIQRNLSLDEVKDFQNIVDGVPVIKSEWPSVFPYLNPYWVTNYDIFNRATDRVFGFVHLKYQITDWLSITGRANLGKTFVKEERKIYQGTAQLADLPGGYYSQANNVGTSQWMDFIIDGENKISSKFKINYQAGGIYSDNKSDQISAVGNGLNVTNKFSINFATKPQITSIGSQVQTQSLFGQASLSYLDGIYLSGSIRNDWDSRLPSPHSFQYYSGGLSAVLSDLVSLPDFLSYLKASVNYSEVGNGGYFGLLNSTYAYMPGVANGYMVRSSTLPIPGLKPEIVRSSEVNIDAGFLNNRINLTLTYYHSNSFNQLLTIGLPKATGFSSQYINAGNIMNKGFEMTLNAKPIQKTDFGWNVDFNLGVNRNKVLSLTDDLDVVLMRSYFDFGGREQIAVGGSYGDILGYGWARNSQGDFLVSEKGTPITDQMAGNSPRLLGNFNPKALLGLSNSFTYKKISLRVLLDGRMGGIIVDGTEQNLSFSGLTKGTLAHREGGWNLDGVDLDGNHVTNTISASDFWQTVSGKRSGTGEFYTYDATNFRVRELSLGYTIPLDENLFIKSATVSIIARNLFFIYRGSSKLDVPGLPKRKMSFDPDMSQSGVMYGTFPSTRSVGINLNLSF